MIGSFQKGGLVQLANDGVQLRSQRIAAARDLRSQTSPSPSACATQPRAESASCAEIVGRSLQAVMRNAVHSAIWQDYGNA